MKKIGFTLLLLMTMLSACVKKNVSAHSTLLGWDIPNSLVSETKSAEETLNSLANIYKMSCGDSESFDLIDKTAFDKSYAEILSTRGYKQTAGPYEDDLQVYVLTGPKSLLAMISKSKFAVCELV